MFSAHFILWAFPSKFEYIGIAMLASMANTAIVAAISRRENAASLLCSASDLGLGVREILSVGRWAFSFNAVILKIQGNQ